MNKVAAALGAAGVTGLLTAGVVVSASGASAAGCTGSVLVSADYVRLFGGSPVVGSIQLRRDSCYRYWGQITMYDSMKSNTFAIAYVTRFTDGVAGDPVSCDADGGNGRVVTNQTTCRTPRVSARSRNVKVVASGHEFQNGGGGWTRISWGQTKLTR